MALEGLSRLAPVFPPALPVGAFRAALAHPLGSPRLRELASGKRRVVVLLEDASRPARTAGLVESILAELAEAKPLPGRMDLLFAGGAHVGLNEASYQSKLPPGPMPPVHHHDAQGPVVTIGYTPQGCEISLNPLVVAADLRVGLGTVNFHPSAGFSGGAKLVFPGTASLASIVANHSLPHGRRGLPDNPWRRGIEAVHELVPLHFLVAILARPEGGIAGCWAGAPGPVEAAARQRLVEYALLRRPAAAGFCLVGMAPFDRSLLGFFKAVDLCLELLSPTGTGVIAGDCPEGLGHHLWRWSDEVMRRTKQGLSGQIKERTLYLLAPGVALAEAGRMLPEEIRVLAGPEEAAALTAGSADPGYLVPYGPLTALADEPGGALKEKPLPLGRGFGFPRQLHL